MADNPGLFGFNLGGGGFAQPDPSGFSDFLRRLFADKGTPADANVNADQLAANPLLAYLGATTQQPPVPFSQARPMNGPSYGPLPQQAPQLPPPVNVASLPQPPQADIPPAAQPTGPASPQEMPIPPQAAPQFPPQQPPDQSPGIMDRLSAVANNLTTGSNPLAGLFNAVQGGITGQRLDPQGMMLQQMRSTYQALVSSGVPSGMAQAAALNPEVLKTIAPMLVNPSERVSSGKDPLTGQENFTYLPKYSQGGAFGGAAANVNGAAAGASPTGQPVGASGNGIYAQGVTHIDPSLKGDAYLAQFGPLVQASVRARIDGRQMPSARGSATPNQIQMIAQKYGDDIGVPADDASYHARVDLLKKLQSSELGTIGGQIQAGNTAIGHLGDLSKAAVDLGNYNFGGVLPGVAHVINDARTAATSDQAAKANAFNDIRERYVQEITKFYSGVAGGEGERDRAIAVFDHAKTGPELASAIAAEASLMQAKVGAIGGKISTTMGPRYLQEHPVISPESQDALKSIAANVSTLRGNGAAPVQQAAAPVTAATYGLLQKGQTYTAPDGTTRVKQ